MVKVIFLALFVVSLSLMIDSKPTETMKELENASNESMTNDNDDNNNDSSIESDDWENFLELMRRLKVNKKARLLEKRLPKWRIFDRPKVNSEIKYENDPYLRKVWDKNMLEKNQMYKNILG